MAAVKRALRSPVPASAPAADGPIVSCASQGRNLSHGFDLALRDASNSESISDVPRKPRTSAVTALSGREGQGWRDYFAYAAPSRDLHRRVGRRRDFGAASGSLTLSQEARFI